MLLKNKSTLSFRRSCLWILFSVCMITGGSVLAWLYYKYILHTHASNDAYRIVAVVQTSPEQELLPNAYFAELLNLSTDHPDNLYRFNTNEARKKLLLSPLIKEATVKRIKPGTIYVDYIPRVPVAFLLDLSNTAIDKEGFLFPIKPFFTPKKLPEIYLGMQSKAMWGDCIKEKHSNLALSLMDYVTKHCCTKNRSLRRIDVSRAFDPSYGRREIVIIMEEQLERQTNDKPILFTCDWILRISPNEHFQQALDNYTMLGERIIKEQPIQKDKVVQRLKIVVDLRLPHLAYIQKDKGP